MSKLAHLLAFVLLAAFAAATFGPVADATAMTVKMSLMPMDDEADCEGCSGDQDKAPLCDQACMTSLPALPADIVLESPAAAAGAEAAPGGLLAGWSGPPDPSPPRTTILS
jgi:hypothetical protein